MAADILFPPAFEKRVQEDQFLGQNLLTALQSEVPTSVRFNPSKNIDKSSNLLLKSEVPWCKDAYYLNERPIFTLDPLFHAGVYYPQEAGSMMLDKVLRQLNLPDEAIILDLCAAPGGKSTLISSFLNEKGLLVSNEIIPNRSKILAENMVKWGFSNTIVCNNEPKDLGRLHATFDCIVVDAPCSGEGMFRKDHHAREEWSEANVDLCSNRQQNILAAIWDSLKPGGYLIYSTCTFNEQENEQVITQLIQGKKAELVPFDGDPFQKGRVGIGYYALPHLVEAEGFYICVLRKLDGEMKSLKTKKQFKSKIIHELPLANHFAKLSGKCIIQWQEFYFAVPENQMELILQLQNELRVIKMGTELGTINKGKLAPHHALAMDIHLLQNKQGLELTREQALRYLKGETFDLKGDRGQQLVTFEGIPLGWVNHLGNRFNNLYPKEWRIRMKLD